MNKKAAEKVFSVYWFVILIIIATSIVLGVLAFYSSVIDVRENEAEILANKVIDCMLEGGVILEDVFVDGFNLEEFCKLNFDDSEFDEGQYYVGAVIFKFGSLERVLELDAGRKDFLDVCNKDKKFPVCVEERVYTTRGEQNYLIEVTSGVRKVEKNVRL